MFSLNAMRRISFTIVLAALMCSSLQAQYYERRSYESPQERFIHVGFLQRDFQPRSSNTSPDSLAIKYNRFMPTIGFRQGLFDITFGYTKFSLKSRSREAVFFAATFENEFVLSGKSPSTLVLPILIATDFTKSEGVGDERDNFNIASVGFGGGLTYRCTGESFDFSVRAAEILHFSFEGLNTGSGFSAATIAEATFLLQDAPVFDGIAFGYRFRLQTWSMNEARFDYRSVSHGPFIGVMF